jgi:DNA-binding NarL/FixJ family response regulator
MPGRNGLEVLKDVKLLKPSIAVLILSILPEKQYAIRALKLGAAGYLVKSTVPEELIVAIRRAAQGKKYITPSLAEKLTLELNFESDQPLYNILSNRELEVLCLLAKGNPIKVISEMLSLSPKTVTTYHKRIQDKLNLSCNAEIIRYAIENSLID